MVTFVLGADVPNPGSWGFEPPVFLRAIQFEQSFEYPDKQGAGGTNPKTAFETLGVELGPARPWGSMGGYAIVWHVQAATGHADNLLALVKEVLARCPDVLVDKPELLLKSLFVECIEGNYQLNPQARCAFA